MTKNYKIVCPPLNLVLLIKKYDVDQEKKLWDKLRKKVSTAKEPINIEEYMEAIIKCFMVDSEAFFEKVEPEERSNIVQAAYASIISLYPIFQLEWICNELNTGIFSESMRALLTQGVPDLKLDLEEPIGAPLILDKKKVDHIHEYLCRNLIGQEAAVDKVSNSLKIIAAGLASFSSFFFVGPTGVGKTQLARLLGKQFGNKFFKINCGEFSQGHEYSKLIGSPPGYVGHADHSILSEKAEESSRWVFLFDEIEKAHHKFYDFLLSLLDDGTVTDNMGRELDFSDSIFIFTSNQGMSDLKLGKSLGFGQEEKTYDQSKAELKESIKKHFPPEFINRIDEFVMFNQLNKKDVRKIATLELRGIPIKKTKSLLDYVVKGGYSEEYGARNIKRFIKSNITIKVAESILDKVVPKKEGALYSPKIQGDELFIVDTIPYKEVKK